MEPHRFLVLLLAIVMGFFGSSPQALKFEVGGKDGWVPNPSEGYNHWAERLRFQVNDSLVFKYRKGSDSVLVVTAENYDKCEGKHAIKALKGGDSVFTFDRSGPFFFISGNHCNCKKGQKLVVVVLAVRNKGSPPPPASPPAAPSQPPATPTPPPASPPALAPEPSEGQWAPAPAPRLPPSASTALTGWGPLGLGLAACWAFGFF